MSTWPADEGPDPAASAHTLPPAPLPSLTLESPLPTVLPETLTPGRTPNHRERALCGPRAPA